MSYFGKDVQSLEKDLAIFTAKEICQQPSTWIKTVNQVKNESSQIKAFIEQVTLQEDYRIVLVGAGTSEFVGNSLFSFLNTKYNGKVVSCASTDIVATPENYLSRTLPTLVVSFGRSGNSPESVGAVDAADVVCNSVYHLFVTCNHNGALSKRAIENKNCYALNLTKETHDQAFAMTSSFTNMLLATLICLDLENIEQLENQVEDLAKAVTKFTNEGYTGVSEYLSSYNFGRIVYLGSNALKGYAQESALKMLELTAGLVPTMFDSPLGFRHGPKSIVNDETLTVVYLSDNEYTYRYELDLIKEMSKERKNNQLLVVANTMREEILPLVDYAYFFNMSKQDNVFLGLAYITIAQYIALIKSLSYGITPDNPCPSGEVNRVVKGVTLYPYKK